MPEKDSRSMLLIFNPQANGGRAKKILSDILLKFESKNFEIDVKLTEHRKHGMELVSEADFDVYDGVLAAGGDGTLFEVINGYFHNKSKKRIPIGVIPVGTGNAFARDLDLTNEQWSEAVDIIAANKLRKVDVGHYKTDNGDFYYLNILGMGFVSDVTKTAHGMKKILGNFSYTIGVFSQTTFLKTHHLTIEIDGEKLEQENIFVEISNTRYTSNFFMAPKAKIDDGKLDVVLLSKVTRRKLLSSFPKIFTGEHILLPEVAYFQAKKIKIETDVPKILTPDGEIYGQTPAEVECLHQAVEIFDR